MLVIANGAFKSGSTWQYLILKQIVPSQDVPVEYRNPGWVNLSIDPKRLRDFLDSELYRFEHFVVKNHFSRPAEFALLNDRANIMVFDIKRDIKDVVVSAFYHYKNHNGFSGRFRDFFDKQAHKLVRGIVRHNDLWRSGGSNVYSGSYETLSADFSNEVFRMGLFLGHKLDPVDIDRIEETTSFSKLSSEGSPFFRKGEVGDWKNHFTYDQFRAISDWVSNPLSIEERDLSVT